MVAYRLGMDLAVVVQEIAELLGGTAERWVRASRAAEAIRGAGGYRWVGLYDVAGERVVNLAWTGPAPPAHPVFGITEGLTGTAIATRATVLVGDVGADPRYLEALGDTRSEIVVPVCDPDDGVVLGTLDVESDRREAFTPADQQALERVAAALLPLWTKLSPGSHMAQEAAVPAARRNPQERPPDRPEHGSMLVEETVTYLEMTSPDQLRPGRPAPAPVAMVKLDRTAASLLRSTYARIGAPLNWQSRRFWADERWEQLLGRQDVHTWIARVGDEVAGMVELEVQPGGDVEIVVFGLVPEFIGKGFGAHVLTVGTRLAWQVERLDGVPVRRVWLHTSSRDNPHAKPNYERRGFRPFRTEQRQREVWT
jgi:putative methionine-R-sulfoxide reductase with GAF domain/GNAT superfamily N-acetyltransferase